MEQKIVFEDKDEALISKIEAYRCAKVLSFEDAVKELCRIALEENGLKWEEFGK